MAQHGSTTIAPDGGGASSLTVEDAMKRVTAIDLEPIAFKLIHPEPGQDGVSLAEADRMIGVYRQFLALNLLYPERSLVPSKQVDTVWHTHILDTINYRADCEMVFGFFLDHFPYLGLRGAEDEIRWRQSYEVTSELFEHHFGNALEGDGQACGDSPDTPSLCDSGACDSAACTPTPVPDDKRSSDRPRPLRVVA